MHALALQSDHYNNLTIDKGPDGMFSGGGGVAMVGGYDTTPVWLRVKTSISSDLNPVGRSIRVAGCFLTRVYIEKKKWKHKKPRIMQFVSDQDPIFLNGRFFFYGRIQFFLSEPNKDPQP